MGRLDILCHVWRWWRLGNQTPEGLGEAWREESAALRDAKSVITRCDSVTRATSFKPQTDIFAHACTLVSVVVIQ